jgi:TatD DNase family protein
MFIDSHCHIDGSQFDEDRDEVVARAREAGVAIMLCVGTGDPHSGEIAKAVAVAERYEGVYASVGVHPHDAKLYDDAAEEHLIELTKSEKVIAWGEIGLDYYYDHSPRDVQREVFRRQIRTAKSLGLPVIIHSRDADDETVEILTDEFGRRADTPVRMDAVSAFKEGGATRGLGFRVEAEIDTPFLAGGTGDADKSVRAPGVMHCFGGTAEMAKSLMDVGFYISFAGNVTFAKAENLRDAARVVPLDRLLIETDCPFLTPVPLRGKRNEPSFVVHTAAFLADLYSVSVATIAEQTTANFQPLFGLDVNAETPER